MLCSKCGTELPSGAIICWKCGAQQQPGAEAGPQWETCDIRFAEEPSFFAVQGYFWAEAFGPRGHHTVASSARFPPPWREENEAAAAALHALIGELVEEGWELRETRGDDWFSHRLRRRLG